MTRDYSVTIRVKNNRMLEKMRLAGYESAASLSRACGVTMQTIGVYLNLKKAPLKIKGEWSTSVLKIAIYLRCLPEDMFPVAHIRAPLAKNVAEFKADASDIHQISASLRSMSLPADEKLMVAESKQALDDLLGILTPRERNIIEERYGLLTGKEKTYRGISGESKSVERLRQIEFKAIRKLKNRAKYLNLSFTPFTNGHA